ncbi:MAG: helix-turn-helix domain-containing protein [Methylococcaceae bacterium]|nr:helix-turn-helix domain-containing protein [Methylococcaceae bacterium]
MQPAERVKELKRAIQQLKKSPRGGANFRRLTRLQALLAYYRQQPLERIAACYDLNVKSLKRWIKRYETNGLEGLGDAPRSGRLSGLTPEQQALLKAELERDRQRVWG